MKNIASNFSRLVLTLFLLVTFSGCANYWKGVGGRIARGENGIFADLSAYDSPGSGYSSSSSSYSSSSSTCTQCSGQGYVTRQDAWGSDSNGQLINQTHRERCTWCNGTGAR